MGVDYIDDALQKTKSVRDKCFFDVNILMKNYGWDQKRDIRIRSFSKLIYVLMGLNISLWFLTNNLENDELFDDIQFPNRDTPGLESYLVKYEAFIKIGFVASLFSIIESSLRVYLNHLDKEEYDKKKSSIRAVCQCLIEEKIFKGIVRYNMSLFDFLRLIRNSLHNNGVHLPISKKDRNVKIEYREVNYIFADGESIDFVNWDLLLNIADDFRNFLFLIANDEIVSSQKQIFVEWGMD